MFRSLRRLFQSPHPLDPENLGDKARDIVFRVMGDNDIETCLAFYRANEAANFPPGRLELYAERLRSREFLTLLALRSDRPVGCCGIYHSKTAEGIPVGFFCFGMVDPGQQRTGIGTAQVLVRLALLPVTSDLVVAAMAAVPNSMSFYKRFGFVFGHEIQGTDGGTYPLGLLRASASFVADCKVVLEQRRITYPDVLSLIPYRPPT